MKWIKIKKDLKENFTFGERVLLLSYAIWAALTMITFVFPANSDLRRYYFFYVGFIGLAATPIIALFVAIIMGGRIDGCLKKK